MARTARRIGSGAANVITGVMLVATSLILGELLGHSLMAAASGTFVPLTMPLVLRRRGEEE